MCPRLPAWLSGTAAVVARHGGGPVADVSPQGAAPRLSLRVTAATGTCAAATDTTRGWPRSGLWPKIQHPPGARRPRTTAA